MSFRTIPDSHISNPSQYPGVWIIAGPNWRSHIQWRIDTLLSGQIKDSNWIGSGSLGIRFPPSGLIEPTRKGIGDLLRRWKKDDESLLLDNESNTVTMTANSIRLLVVEDPQGAGIWDELNRSPAWKEIIETAHHLRCIVIVGTSLGIPKAGLLLECADWLLLRCNGGEQDVNVLTSGTTSLGNWLDGVGRDVFDDIRVYRRLLSVIASHKRDLVINLSSESEIMTDRIFWWDSEKECINERKYAHQRLRRSLNPDAPGDVAIRVPRIVRKLRLVIGILEELCDELEGGGSDDE